MSPVLVGGSVCRCDERKAELRARGVLPLFGRDEYMAADFARWVGMKAADRLKTLR